MRDEEVIHWPITEAVAAYVSTWFQRHATSGDEERCQRIRDVGMDRIDPILVKTYSNGVKVLDGHHRLRVAVEQGLPSIRARVRSRHSLPHPRAV